MVPTIQTQTRMETQKTQRPADQVIASLIKDPKTGAVTYAALRKAIKSRAQEGTIGKHRADKIWGWAARTCGNKGEQHLRAPKGQCQEWLREEERPTLEAREVWAWEQTPASKAQANRAEVTGSVKAWLTEHEAPAKEGTPQTLRPGKLKQLKTATLTMTSTRGGPAAVMASLAILTSQGALTLAETPNRPSRQGPWTTWYQDAWTWMAEEGWSRPSDTCQPQEPTPQRSTYLVMDLGEGWGSVGRAIRDMGMSIRVVGVDNRGATNTGTTHGIITAEIAHDFSTSATTDIITAVSRKVGVTTKTWSLVWMSMDCKLFSRANAMNQATGTAHGRWALTALSKANSTQAQQEEEKRLVTEATRAVKHQLEALETHPDLIFALEQPEESQLWDLPVVKRFLKRNPSWVRQSVDQCAFGREAQKPTAILTNSGWTPRGLTGHGRCVIGRCAGTEGNQQGDKKHKKLTVSTSTRRATTESADKTKRRQTTKATEINSVAAPLVQEIMRATLAALQCRELERASRDPDTPFELSDPQPPPRGRRRPFLIPQQWLNAPTTTHTPPPQPVRITCASRLPNPPGAPCLRPSPIAPNPQQPTHQPPPQNCTLALAPPHPCTAPVPSPPDNEPQGEEQQERQHQPQDQRESSNQERQGPASDSDPKVTTPHRAGRAPRVSEELRAPANQEPHRLKRKTQDCQPSGSKPPKTARLSTTETISLSGDHRRDEGRRQEAGGRRQEAGETTHTTARLTEREQERENQNQNHNNNKSNNNNNNNNNKYNKKERHQAVKDWERQQKERDRQ